MSKKPKEKLRRGVIDARELRTLLQQEEWELDRTKGSHEVWIKVKELSCWQRIRKTSSLIR